MKLTAKKIPYSSVVGQAVTLHDETGRVVCQLAIHGVQVGADYRVVATQIADEICARFNTGSCGARQYSDMMVCERCDLRWDTNDPHPPRCRSNGVRA